MRFLKILKLHFNSTVFSPPFSESPGSSEQRRGLPKFATTTAAPGASEIWTRGNLDAWKRFQRMEPNDWMMLGDKPAFSVEKKMDPFCFWRGHSIFCGCNIGYIARICKGFLFFLNI